MAGSAKSKKAKKAPPDLVEAPLEFTVAKCQWCGMQWKHYGEKTPEHFCGKVCASHEIVEPEASE